MIERDSDITQKYSSLRRTYLKENIQSRDLVTVGLTLGDAKSTLEYKTALIQLSALIKTETEEYKGLELAALQLYDSIQKVIKKRGSKIPTPYDDQRYLGPEYIRDRIKELQPKKQKKKPKERTRKPIPLPDIQNNHPKDSQVSSSDEESDAQNDGETASSNSHEQI